MLKYVLASFVLLVACSGKVATQEAEPAPPPSTPVDAGSTNADPATCAADTRTCMACCRASFPDGAAFLSRSLTRLDNIANEWCGPPPDQDFGEEEDNCRSGHSASCRECASKLDIRPLGDCFFDTPCNQMFWCLRGCKLNELEFGL